jgi:RHS repeat-associated protein
VNSTTGTVAQRLDLDEWGQVIADTTAGFQAFGFADGIYDPETGLVRFGVRDYDPLVGRWTARDPIGFEGAQANLFVYVSNDPVNRLDPTGEASTGENITCAACLLTVAGPIAVVCVGSEGGAFWACLMASGISRYVCGGVCRSTYSELLDNATQCIPPVAPWDIPKLPTPFPGAF